MFFLLESNPYPTLLQTTTVYRLNDQRPTGYTTQTLAVQMIKYTLSVVISPVILGSLGDVTDVKFGVTYFSYCDEILYTLLFSQHL